MKNCPHCLRCLLSHASARCNWCGKAIEDGDYQATALAEREAFFTHQAQRDAQSLADAYAINVNAYDPGGMAVNPFRATSGLRYPVPGTASRQPAYETRSAPKTAQEQTPASQADDPHENCENEPETQDRFHHLEL